MVFLRILAPQLLSWYFFKKIDAPILERPRLEPPARPAEGRWGVPFCFVAFGWFVSTRLHFDVGQFWALWLDLVSKVFEKVFGVFFCFYWAGFLVFPLDDIEKKRSSSPRSSVPLPSPFRLNRWAVEKRGGKQKSRKKWRWKLSKHLQTPGKEKSDKLTSHHLSLSMRPYFSSKGTPTAKATKRFSHEHLGQKEGTTPKWPTNQNYPKAGLYKTTLHISSS